MAAAVDEVHFSFPILKFDRTEDGDLVVYGPCTDGTVDADHQRVKPGWSGKALQEWIETAGNVRVQHSPFLYPAGKGLALEVDKDQSGKHYLKALVVEDTAKRLVEKGVLKDFSVGILDPVIVFTDPTAPGGTIVGGRIGEVSLVDRGSNKNTSFQLVKSDSDGLPELVCKVYGAVPPPTPADLRRDAYYRQFVAKRRMADGKVVDSGGRDVSDLPDSDFAGPNKTFPIKNRADVPDAAGLAHHADDPGAVRGKIRSIARRKFGMGDEDMPPSLRESKDAPDTDDDSSGPDSEDQKTCLRCKAKNPASAKRCTKCNKKLGMLVKGDGGQDEPTSDASDDEDEADDAADTAQDNDDSASQPPPKGKKSKADKAMEELVRRQREVLNKELGGAHRGDNGGTPPTGGIPAQGKTSIPAGAHREPDGAVVEGFEHDAGMRVDPDRSDKLDGADPAVLTMKRLHDSVCPAMKFKQVRQTYALKGVGDAMPVEALESAAVAAINDGNLNAANYFLDMAQSAQAIKRIDRAALASARKAYPELFPSMFQAGAGIDRPAQHQDVAPGMFGRGYVSDGHPALSASGGGGGGLPGATVHHVDAGDFTRGPLTAGQADASPGGRQATASTAAIGQAMTTMARLHEQVASGWPELCPVSVTRQNYARDEGGTGFRPPPGGNGKMPPAPGEPGYTPNRTMSTKAEDEPEVRKALADSQLRIRELEEEVAHLGAMPDPAEAPYRGLPELGGPVARKSYIDKAASGADPDDDTDDFLRFVGSFANGGDPTMRQNARKVLKGLITAPVPGKGD